MTPFLIAFDAEYCVVMADDYPDAFDLASRLIDVHTNVNEVVIREISGGEFAEFVRDLARSNRSPRRRNRKTAAPAV